MAKGKYQEWLTKEGLLKLEAWARNGLTDEQIANNMGISTATLYNYKNKHLEILEALKKGKEVVDIQVENALHKSAVGYEYTERTAKVVDRDKALVEAERREYENRYKIDHPEAELQEVKDAAIKAVPTRERIVILEVDKQVAPNPTSAIFWLKNRMREIWKDKQELEHSGGVDIRKRYGEMSDEELEELVKRYEKINDS